MVNPATTLTDPFGDPIIPTQRRTLQTPLTACIPATTAQIFAQHLNLHTIEDLLCYYPRRYRINGPLTLPAPHHENQPITCYLTITNKRLKGTRTGRKMLIITGHPSDGENTSPHPLTATFFNGFETNRALNQGDTILITGTLTGNSLDKPTYETTPALLTRPLTAIYPANKHITTETIAETIATLLPTLTETPDPLPEHLRTTHAFPTLHEALTGIHTPTSEEHHQRARARLTYDEALAMQLTLAQNRQSTADMTSHALTETGGIIDEYTRSLPYTLTAGQQSAISRIFTAQAQPHPLNALLLGDVGAGKTTVAAYALLHGIRNGHTVALIAPTEVLAEQHYESLRKTLPATIETHLLTGSTEPEPRKHIHERIRAGAPALIIGTHALFSKRLKWANLAVVVIDEQHRFGVAQRDTFNSLPTRPHTLNMTATPIPRTIAMTTYGDLEIIKLPGLPAGRQPIRTHIINTTTHTSHYQRMWQKMAEEAADGHQGFIVAPKINHADPDPETDPEDTHTTTHTIYDIANELTRHAPHLTYSILHGKMTPEEKQHIMDDFAAGNTHILISTTVIEVGVNVPNATTITIINSERFGAAQLHQLRGRVGRGGHQGYCFLVTAANPETDTTALTRLGSIAATLDGTRIAEIDLQTRGEGHILGTRQQGTNDLTLLTLNNTPTITNARHDATTLTTADPHLTRYPALATWLYHHRMRTAAHALMRN